MPHHRSGGGQLSRGTAGTLKSRETHAPDGGAPADYPKGWRFLPSGLTDEQQEILKNNPRVASAMRDLHNPPQGRYGKGSMTQRQYEIEKATWEASQHQIIADAHYNLIIAPQIKAQEEALQKKEEMERQAIATLKMRVQELEQKQEPEPTSQNYLPLALIPVVIIGAVLLLRRRG